MKYFLSLCVVLAVAALANGTEPEGPTAVDNPDYEQITPLRLLFRTVVVKPAIPNQFQSEDVVFRGDGRTVIRGINHHPVGGQNAAVRVTRGGVRHTYATVNVHSFRGQGYHIVIEMWG